MKENILHLILDAGDYTAASIVVKDAFEKGS
jgi:hypothetical protein